MSGSGEGTSMGSARQTARNTADTLKRFAREHRMVGNSVLFVAEP